MTTATSFLGYYSYNTAEKLTAVPDIIVNGTDTIMTVTVWSYGALVTSVSLGAIVTSLFWWRGWIRAINARFALCCCPVRRGISGRGWLMSRHEPDSGVRPGGASERALVALGKRARSGGRPPPSNPPPPPPDVVEPPWWFTPDGWRNHCDEEVLRWISSMQGEQGTYLTEFAVCGQEYRWIVPSTDTVRGQRGTTYEVFMETRKTPQDDYLL